MGWVFGRLFRSARLGLLGYVLVGAGGGYAVGWLFGLLVEGERFWGSIPIAFAASVTLVLIARTLSLMRPR